MIRVLIADDEALMRAGVRLILQNADDIEIVAEEPDGKAAVDACRQHMVDVALLDMRMPGGDGTTAAADIVRESPRTNVLMLTAFGDDPNVDRALAAGATGFLLKDTAPTELINAVRRAAAGEPVLAPQVTRRLIQRHLTANSKVDNAALQLVNRLTNAERDVLRLVASGLSNTDIAGQMYISVSTVKAHLSQIFSKLGCANRVQAAMLASDAGLLAEDAAHDR